MTDETLHKVQLTVEFTLSAPICHECLGHFVAEAITDTLMDQPRDDALRAHFVSMDMTVPIGPADHGVTGETLQ